MPLPRFRLRTLMIAVAAIGLVMGLIVVAYREANRLVNAIEAEHYHFRAREASNAAVKAAYTKQAEFYDRRVRYYGGR